MNTHKLINLLNVDLSDLDIYIKSSSSKHPGKSVIKLVSTITKDINALETKTDHF